MKKVLFTLLMACSTVYFAQAQSCCSLSAPDEFALFADDGDFNAKHLNPLPYTHQSEIGKNISFKGSDGKEAYGYELKAAKPSKKYLFVIHEWWGLNDHIKREAEKLYNDLGDVNVIAIDLYDQKVADNRNDAAKYMQAVQGERAVAILEGARSYAGKNAKIATIGWCFGGGWSLQASILLGKQAAGCVIYYGMPEKDLDKLKGLQTKVLGIFASKEQWISPAVVDEFEANMKKVKKNLTLKRFDAEHAFANPSNPAFDKEATEQAYAATMEFLKKQLK